MKQNILLVDGYNIICDWKELNELQKINLAEARDRLIEMMAGYRAAQNWRVILVFDAHSSLGIAQTYEISGIEVIYTNKGETADDRIEKLSLELKSRFVQVHVATSDMAEQSVAFNNGALRISARQLEIDVREARKNTTTKVRATQQSKPSNRPFAGNEKLEELRRKS